MSDEIINGLMPTDEELIEQGVELDEDPNRLAQDEADGLEDANISA